MDRVNESFSQLELRQMATIDKLQEKIKLLEFDKASRNNTIRELKFKLKIRDITLKSAIEELEKIIRDENYEKISNVIFSLKSSVRRQTDFEECSLYDTPRTRN